MDRKKFVSQLAAGATAIAMLQTPLAGWAKSLPKKSLPQDVPPNVNQIILCYPFS
jgi:hypothetical protein